MNELQKLYAKYDELKAKAEQLNADENAKTEDIKATLEEIKNVKAKIAMEEQLQADEKEEAQKQIDAGNMNALNGDEGEDDVRASTVYAEGFYNFVRGQALTAEQREVVNVISTTGVPVPKSFQNKLIVALEEMNVMRKLANVITTETDKDIPIVATKGSADWTAENGAYNESDDTFDTITLSAFKLTRILKVSEEILEDNTFGLEDYLVQSFARSLAQPEEAAFINGDGVDKPEGVFVGAEVGVTAASAIAITADEIIDLYYSLTRPYRQNATWLMNDKTIKAIRKLKDSNDDYLWQKGLGGEPDTILGRPIESAGTAPDIATGNRPIAFGDMKYYTIADRSKRTFQRLNELYAAEGQVGFKGYERVDGKLALSEAVKALVMA